MDTEKESETACRLCQATGLGELICGDRQTDRQTEREQERARDGVKERERDRASVRASRPIATLYNTRLGMCKLRPNEAVITQRSSTFPRYHTK